MIVTNIKEQKKDPAMRNIYVDHTYVFSLTAQDVRYFKLEEGREIPQETFDFIQENLIYIKAQDTALRYLGYKMRTRAEVRRKLEEGEFAPETVERVMDFLERYGYCDDLAYARAFVKERQRLRPKGAYALKMELRQRGVAETVIEEVLTRTEINETSDALRWLEKKTKGRLPQEEKERQRLYGFLQRKGYSWDVIREAFQLLAQGEGERE